MPPPTLNAWLRRSLAVWLAVLLALTGALAPALTHAFALTRAGPTPMREVCTSTGPGVVATLAGADSPDTEESAPAPEHCRFCLPSTDRDAPAPQRQSSLSTVLRAHGEPTIWQAFFFFAPLAFTPPPRGPPGYL